MKKHIGHLISIKFTDRKEAVYGFVMDYNEDWTLMKYNPTDYIVDGYVICRHKNIQEFQRNVREKFREKVIKLKELESTDEGIIPINNLSVILNFITINYGVFLFHTKSEKVCYVGRLKSLDSKYLVIDYLNSRGKWDGQMKFRPGDIRIIEFNTDYINSLKLVSTPKKGPSRQ